MSRLPWLLAAVQVAALSAADPLDATLEKLIALSGDACRSREALARKPIEEAEIHLGAWQCIGPFKDAEYGLFSREFETVFGPEADIVAKGADPADLEKAYQSVPVVGQADTSRRWVPHKEWADGYFHQLPVGPPPSRNEVVYVYRIVSAKKPVTVQAHLIATDAVKVWLNGKLVCNGPIRGGAGHRFLHVAFPLPLQGGENRLLVKIVSCYQKHGFSFAIEGLHPVHSFLKGQPVASEKRAFTPAWEPYASALWLANDAKAPETPWYVKKETWQEALLASLEARTASRPKGRSPDLPYKSPVFRPKDAAQHVRLNVAGLDRLVLAATIAGDNYDYDDSIWADPKLIAKDGKEVWLTDLKPTAAKVGFAELFVNKNWKGKPLQIGDKVFQRGFWAHAPSLVVFDLGGKFEWFDAWIGLDKLAWGQGTAEFVVSEDAMAATAGDADPLLHARLQRDFLDRRSRYEMSREFADGIWAGIQSSQHVPQLYGRYARAILRTLALPPETTRLFPWEKNAQGVASVRELYRRVKRLEESLDRVRKFRLDVEPLPNFEPPRLRMQEALDKVESTPGGAEYLKRLAPVREAAKSALAAYGDGNSRAEDAIVRAAEGIGRFQADRIRAIGPIVFVRRPFPGRINAPDPYSWPRKGPASIAVFDPAHPDQPPRVVYDDPTGSIYNMSLSFDAKTLFFSALRRGVPGGWQIYEIGVDGTGFKQITRETRPDSGKPLPYGGFHHPNPSVDNNVSPIELPSGELMFVSSRAGNVVVCQPGRAGVLYVCHRDGSRVRRVSGNTLSDHTPAVMDDGRVMFTRWDYGVDKGVFERQGVWTMNPNGTRLQLFFGNTIADPNAFWQCVPVPGRPEVVSTFGGHHSGPYGLIGLLWNRLGDEAPRGEGFRWLTPEYPTYFDGNFEQGYVDPFPLNEHEFLVSYGGDGERRNRLYWLDNRGNRRCIWEEAELGCYNPIPLRPRPRPPVIAPPADQPGFVYVDPVVAALRPDDHQQGVFLLLDVYEGLFPHVRRGEIRWLQILEQLAKPRPHTGGYAWNISPLIGRGTFYVRRLIGIVPVEEDGSAFFSAPALRNISFNALDAEGRMLQKMGSTTQTMPGEVQGCIGCHEPRRVAPSNRNVPLAARRPPSEPQRPDWGTDGIIDYCLVVQPAWDRYCVKCHSGPQPKGNLDLSGDKTRYFNMSYNMLIDRGFVHHTPMNGADHDHTTPRATGSPASSLLKYIETDHYGPPLPREARQRVYTWIDANIPYYHTYLYTDGSVNGARDRWYDDVPEHWFRKDFAPVFMRRCFDCHKRQVDISEAWIGRCVVTVTSKMWTDTTLMDQGLQIENAIPIFGPAHRINLTHPQWSQMLTAPLAKDAGGLGLCKDANGGPIFMATDDRDYQAMLRALQMGKVMLEANPRVDMLPRPTRETAASYAEGLRRPRIVPKPE